MEADLRELARLPDFLAVCSSAGWTDQKHMLYLSLLQESFVNRLHEHDLGFKGLFSLSPRPSRTTSKVVKAKSCRKVEQIIRPPCCEHGEDGEDHSTDDDASTTETVQESSSSEASATSHGRSSVSRSGKREHSPSRTADTCKRTTYSCVSSEGSDQNFVDEDVEDTNWIGESRRRRGKKRLKSADDRYDGCWMIKRCVHEGRTTASGLPQCKKRGHRWP
ncbi:hypothetical protein ACQ4PT_015343 [Festuca glaucescens]